MQHTILEILNIFIHFLTYLPASILLNQTRALETQQRDTLLNDRLESKG